METIAEELLKLSEMELIYRTKVKASQRLKIESSRDAYAIFKKTWDENKIELCEQAKMLVLNKACKVLGLIELSTGSVCGTIIDPRQVITTVLKANGTSAILCHNHPSGNTTPSTQDEILTAKLKEGAALLQIKILDHLIITSEGYLSMADEGLM